MLLTATLTCGAEDFAYQAQGKLFYRVFLPPTNALPRLVAESDFQETTLFDLDVKQCRFYMKLRKVPGDPKVQYHEVGTDGVSIYQQTVFNSTVRALSSDLVGRADNSSTQATRTSLRRPANNAAASIHPGIFPRDRAYHESIVWLALASQCSYVNTGAAITVPRLWEYGDNYYQSHTSRVNAIVVNYAEPPHLPKTVAFLGARRPPEFEYYDEDTWVSVYTNHLYEVQSTTNADGLVLPREFTVVSRVLFRNEADEPVERFLAAYKGEVTRAVRGSLMHDHVPTLASAAKVSDFRYYRRNPDGTASPVSDFMTNWDGAATRGDSISLERAFGIITVPSGTTQGSPVQQSPDVR